jgi:hypothetical protein
VEIKKKFHFIPFFFRGRELRGEGFPKKSLDRGTFSLVLKYGFQRAV